MALWKSRSEEVICVSLCVLLFSAFFCVFFSSAPAPQRRGGREAAEFSRDVTQLAGNKKSVCFVAHPNPSGSCLLAERKHRQFSRLANKVVLIGPENYLSRARTPPS